MNERVPQRAQVRSIPMTTSPSVPRSPGLSNSIVEQLKQLIYTGEFKPGDRLNEAALALRMGTSRGPIREAVRVLAGLGIVTAVPNKGVYVRQLTLREALELYELRALVFGYAAERACDHMTEEHRQRCEALLAGMDQACEAGEGTVYYELNLQFHALIMQLSNNRRAQQAYDDYVKELHLVRRRYFNAPGNMRRSNVEHRAIFDAIVANNAVRARAAAERHVQAGRVRLMAFFEDS